MARQADCKKGNHSYASAGDIGGGIERRTCSRCGFVQIDISATNEVAETGLFTEPKLATMFKVEAMLAQVADEPVPVSRSFGTRPNGRRRPAKALG